MSVLKYWDAASSSYKTISGPPGPQGPVGPAGGAPAGGATNQVLAKNSNTDFDTGWKGPMLSLTGGTLTGALTIAPASGGANFSLNKPANAGNNNLLGLVGGLTRWAITPGNSATESGSNAGSDFTIARYTDAGTIIDTPLSINRASGETTLSQSLNLLSTTGAMNLRLNTPVNSVRQIVAQAAGAIRWVMNFGTASETGSNVGSDLYINRYNDAGTLIDTPLSINRASGQATFTGPVQCNSAGNNLTLSGAAGTYRIFSFATGGAVRFQFVTNTLAETGGNVGSDFNFQCNNDAGAFLGAVFSVVRSTQIVSFAKAIVNGPSDRTLKEHIVPLEGSLDKVLALQGVSFDFIGKEGRQIGLIAQDVEPIVPEVIQPYSSQDGDGQPTAGLLALDYPKLTALLIEAIKELNAKIVSLEARLGA